MKATVRPRRREHAGADRRALAAVRGLHEHLVRTGGARRLGGAVGRAVVDHHDLELVRGQRVGQLGPEAADGGRPRVGARGRRARRPTAGHRPERAIRSVRATRRRPAPPRTAPCGRPARGTAAATASAGSLASTSASGSSGSISWVVTESTARSSAPPSAAVTTNVTGARTQRADGSSAKVTPGGRGTRRTPPR